MTPTETFDQHRDRVIETVRGDLWAYQLDYSCPLCGRVSLDGSPHVHCLRASTQNRITVGELAAVLGVGTTTEDVTNG